MAIKERTVIWWDEVADDTHRLFLELAENATPAEIAAAVALANNNDPEVEAEMWEMTGVTKGAFSTTIEQRGYRDLPLSWVKSLIVVIW
jgi:hypothetical protein